MKLSSQHEKARQSSLEAALKLVDDEMARIVAEIGALRQPRPASKPRGPRGRTGQPARAA